MKTSIQLAFVSLMIALNPLIASADASLIHCEEERQYTDINLFSEISDYSLGAAPMLLNIHEIKGLKSMKFLSKAEQSSIGKFFSKTGDSASIEARVAFLNGLDETVMKRFSSLSDDIAWNAYKTKTPMEMSDAEFVSFLGRIERIKGAKGLNVKNGNRIGPLQRAWRGPRGDPGAVFEIEAADIIGADKIREMSFEIPGSEVDIVLKDGTFVECKSWSLNTQKDNEMIRGLKKQINNMRNYNSENNIKIVFDKRKGIHPELRTMLENEMKVTVEVI